MMAVSDEEVGRHPAEDLIEKVSRMRLQASGVKPYDPTEEFDPRGDRDPMAAEERPTLRRLRPADLKNLPEPTWLADGMVPLDTFAAVFGAPGSAKSFWALHLACCVASGYDFFGSPVKQGQVMYVVGEGMRGMDWRIEAWKLANPKADVEALNRNLLLVDEPVRLLDKLSVIKFVNTAEDVASDGSVRLVVIDTWARAMVGGDENSAQDTGLAIDVCERVRRITKATVMVVHHTGADGTRERGSTALRGAADAMYLMQNREGDVALKCDKLKDGKDKWVKVYRLSDFGHSASLVEQTGPLGSTAGMFRKKESNYDWKAKMEEPF
jgi:hypothetical protein